MEKSVTQLACSDKKVLNFQLYKNSQILMGYKTTASHVAIAMNKQAQNYRAIISISELVITELVP